MPKISYSLAIAFAIHILILAGSTFLIDKAPLPFLIDPKSLINVQLGDGNGRQGRKTHFIPTQFHSGKSSEAQTGAAANENAVSEMKAASENGSGTGVGSGSGNGSSSYDFNASAVSYKDPTYPRLAIKRELQGSVKVRVSVSPEGRPSNIEILKSSGHDLLDRAAIDAISDWKFLPRSAPYFVEKNITFQLKN
ncbi:energy transducer TonB [Bacteriovorax sp. PP10]|uniref:Energy transducer TonB n=1 Tax=Bacteriovorax antarcticus TaxID=3088717 RepID=A0ABU5VRK0_9BACT|nr:energy transducer TonB [Bacteriovorax sp. PP10]MEA9355669.1 energy transducer TonB [Bacteriovorax sp. PP10]